MYVNNLKSTRVFTQIYEENKLLYLPINDYSLKLDIYFTMRSVCIFIVFNSKKNSGY